LDDPALRCEDAGVGFAARTPLAGRASAAERERAVRRLRAGRLSDRLSLETFAERVELAYSATSREQLSALLVDLPERGPVERAVIASVTAVSRWAATLEWAWHSARLPRLVLPTGERAVVGRSRDCDCVLGDPTVSRNHAVLRHADGRWWVADLASLNGTWLNGRRISDEVEVRPGDEIAFGETSFRVTAAPALHAGAPLRPQPGRS
jgi:FHA domain/Domain of unknown function (DUF1707)